MQDNSWSELVDNYLAYRERGKYSSLLLAIILFSLLFIAGNSVGRFIAGVNDSQDTLDERLIKIELRLNQLEDSRDEICR